MIVVVNNLAPQSGILLRVVQIRIDYENSLFTKQCIVVITLFDLEVHDQAQAQVV